MFGKTNLLACGYRTAALAQFEVELAEARERRNAARGWRRAILCGVMIGAAVALAGVCGVLPL